MKNMKNITAVMAFFIAFFGKSATLNAQLVVSKNNSVANKTHNISTTSAIIGSITIQNTSTKNDMEIRDITFNVAEFGFSSGRLANLQLKNNGVNMAGTAAMVSNTINFTGLNYKIMSGSTITIELVSDIDLENDPSKPEMPKIGDYFNAIVAGIKFINVDSSTLKTESLTLDLQKNYYKSMQSASAKIPEMKVLLAYPNPVTGGFVNISAQKAGELTFFSASGQEIAKFPVQIGQNVIDISGFKPGIYVVKLDNKSARIVVQ